MNLDLGIIEIFGEEADKKLLTFNLAFNKYSLVFKNMTITLKNQLVKALIQECRITHKSLPLTTKISINEKLEIYIICEMERMLAMRQM